MSYILDALKKADRQRELAKVPTLATVQQPAEVAPRRLWPWIAGAVVIANVGILTWLLTPPRDAPMPTPSESAQSAPAPAPDPAASSGATPPAVATVAPETHPTSPPQPAPETRAPVAAPEPRAPAPAAVSPSPPRAAPSRPAPARATEATAPSKGRTAAVAPSAAPPPADATPKRGDATPPAAGRAAPATKSIAPEQLAPPAAAPAEPAGPKLSAAEIAGKIRIQVLVYSDVPGERLVFLNNQKYVEGQSIDGKLTVERIMPDGVVIGYQGERVTLRAEGSAPR